MSPKIPLGQRENLHLEFKSRDALDRPEIIAREVAAMLNAEGGEVWIGLRDSDGTAVEIEAVAKPDQETDRLQDSLVDRLEPSPLPGEIRVEQVPFDNNGFVLRILVEPVEERKPYALLKSSGRHFQIRIGNRLRNLSREEIRELFARSANAPNSGRRVAAASERLLSEREEFQQSASEQVWLRILPAIDLELDLRSLPLRDLLEDPAKTGNRSSGWHFAQSTSGVRSAQEKRRWSYGQLFEAEVGADGGLCFALSMQSLLWKGEEREIWPLPLLEFPVSAFRLAATIYDRELPTQPEIVSDLALFGIRGWKLREGSPTHGHFMRASHSLYEYTEDEDLIWSRPLVFRYREVLDKPDHCGYRLVRRVYEAFGHREKAMPREFDLEAGRLVLSD